MVNILTKPTTPYEDLQKAVKAEITEVLKDAAKKLDCHPEQLRVRIVRNNLTGHGGYEVERIPDDEVEKMQKLENLKRIRRNNIKRATNHG
jgi:hypothetical protein